MRDLEAIENEISALRKEYKEAAQLAFTDATKQVFEGIPNLQAIKWRQYTPYFNDGDACTFSVHDSYVLLDGAEEDSGDYGDGFEEGAYALRDTTNLGRNEWRGRETPESKLFDKFEKLKFKMGDILEEIYGDHVEVVLYRNGTQDVDEYYHD